MQRGSERSPRALRRRDGSGGFTLLELLLVMVLLGVIVGIGLGTFASFDPGRRAARGLVAGALRNARNEAIANRAPARVRINPETGTLRSESFAVAGTWRFEDATLKGARDSEAGFPEGFPGEYLGDGFVGKALDLDLGPRGARVLIDLSEDPIFQIRRGFKLGCALRPAQLAEADILDYGGVVRFKLHKDGSVSFRVATRRIDELGRSTEGETINMRTTPGALEAGHWGQIELRYDGQWLTALANGVPVAERAENRQLWDVAKPLVLGGGRVRFVGRIDDLVVSVLRRGDRITLPRTARFVGTEPYEVRFDGGGRLDPLQHARPVEVAILFDDDTQDKVTVRTYGTVE